MKVTFLGTGTSQGVPVITCECEVCRSNNEKDKRLRTSVLVETNELNIVIDTGPDFRQQMLRENVKSLDAILMTHEHKDHVAGLDDVRSYNFSMKKAMDLYAEKRVQESLKREFAYVFADKKYPGIPQIQMHLIENEIFYIGNQKIVPIRAMHYKLPVFGFRINDFVYITDTNFIPEEEYCKIEGARVIVVNALRKEKHLSHFTLDEAVLFLKKFSPEKAYLTHISHMMGFHNKIESELPGWIHLAYDGLKISL